MRPRTYRVVLDEESRVRPLLITRQGRAPAYTIRRAHTLLRGSEGASDRKVVEALHVVRFSVLSRQCLDRRPASREAAAAVVAAPEETRNAERVTVNWRFTTPACAHPPGSTLPGDSDMITVTVHQMQRHWRSFPN